MDGRKDGQMDGLDKWSGHPEKKKKSMSVKNPFPSWQWCLPTSSHVQFGASPVRVGVNTALEHSPRGLHWSAVFGICLWCTHEDPAHQEERAFGHEPAAGKRRPAVKSLPGHRQAECLPETRHQHHSGPGRVASYSEPVGFSPGAFKALVWMKTHTVNKGFLHRINKENT